MGVWSDDELRLHRPLSDDELALIRKRRTLWLETAPSMLTLAEVIIRGDVFRLLDEVERLRLALAEAAIPLEALWATEHDGRALAPEMQQGIREGLQAARAALGIAPPPEAR